MSKTEYRPLGGNSATYGWTGMPSTEFAERMRLAHIRFLALLKIHKFDAIAFAGSSGCAIAFNLAANHNIPLIYVRKKMEMSHSISKVECNNKSIEIKKYLIVDDFVDTGSTINYIIDSISTHASAELAYPAKPVGVLCYDPYVSKDITMPSDIGPLTLFSVDPMQKKKRKKDEKLVEDFIAGGTW